jgi:hypothetical protein
LHFLLWPYGMGRRERKPTRRLSDWNMKGRDVSFIGMVTVVIGGLQTLSLINKPPLMPSDLHHTAISRDVRDQCLQCHHAQTLQALEQATRHPIQWRDARTTCVVCHIPNGDARKQSTIQIIRQASKGDGGDNR